MRRVVHDKRRAAALVEEAPAAYREIREVLEDEADLVKPLVRLEPQGRAREAPGRAHAGPRRARCVHRRDVRLLARDGARPARRRRQGPRRRPAPRHEAQDALPDGAVVSPVQRSLEYALEHAAGDGDALFQPWGNVRRDLASACERPKIERVSPNDLRRTFANWYVAAGMPLFPIAQAMGHKDTRMLERVYGRQSPDQLAAAFSRALGLAPDCSAGATDQAENGGSSGPDGPPGIDSAASAQLPLFAENQRARQAFQPGGPRCPSLDGVPGAGIEPATRGFSVPCSTD